uniref:Reverse transcriptase domain-containing protein n=1 Tax=Leptobrachium leishanense TaxID=445787 RepID=A0A8C5MP15_9ANUR
MDTASDNNMPSSESINRYLEGKLNRTLPQESSDSLDAPISAAEIQRIVTRLKGGKCPGPDGLPAEYYKSYSDVLTPHMESLFASLRDGDKLHPHTLSATISVLKKPGKDDADVRNYRPISLLNTDLKILAKIMATRLAPLLPAFIHADQVGFIPGREARDATTRVLSAIGLAKRTHTGLLLLSTDAEKAFDRVSWRFLFSVLARLGVGGYFLSWLEALYTNPTARVKANGALSETFRVRNGTRQGCPLSPLLFALSLEPLLESIRLNPSIAGIQGHTSEHKVSAYADDLLFLLSSLATSLPAVVQTLEEYGTLAAYCINRAKSEFLGISLDHSSISYLRRSYSFRYCPDRMRYLGVWLASSTRLLHDLNFLAILLSFRTDMAAWTGGLLSWFGRIAVLKMNLMPRLLYLFNALAITIPLSFFTALRSELLKFVWPRGCPRVGFAVLCRPKASGGLALPDPRKYYLACHLARVVEWSGIGRERRWLDLERALTDRPLWTLPWLPPPRPTAQRADPDPMSATLHIWHTRKISLGLSSSRSPLLPLSHNPELLSGILPSLRARMTDSDRLQAIDLPPGGNLELSPRSIQLGPLSYLEQFNFYQLKSYLRSLNCSFSLSRPLLPFERLCQAGHPLTRGISTLYGMIMSTDTEAPSFEARWERELGFSISPDQWSKTYTLVHKGSSATRIQETSFKLLSFWYKTPSLLHSIYPSTPSECWRCAQDTGTLSHIWWSCPRIKGFWCEVQDAICQVTDVKLPHTPECFLLF